MEDEDTDNFRGTLRPAGAGDGGVFIKFRGDLWRPATPPSRGDATGRISGNTKNRHPKIAPIDHSSSDASIQIGRLSSGGIERRVDTVELPTAELHASVSEMASTRPYRDEYVFFGIRYAQSARQPHSSTSDSLSRRNGDDVATVGVSGKELDMAAK